MTTPEQRGGLGESRSAVSAAWIAPPSAAAWLVVGHGAGAGVGHPVLVGFARAVAGGGALGGVRAVAGGLPVLAGGKSLGARIASMCVADGMPAAGLVFVGYPLHPPSKPERIRDKHLYEIEVPLLFLQGTRDPFAQAALLSRVLKELGPRAELHAVEGGDHSFRVRGVKAEDREIGASLAAVAAPFVRRVAGAG